MSLTIDETASQHLHRLALEHFRALEQQDLKLAAQVLRADYVNEMAADEPPACARPGVPGLMATAAWLHLAFPDLRSTSNTLSVTLNRPSRRSG